MPSILEGIRVLDLTRIVAGPWCTQILADLGATVYKIEKPGEGDDCRRMAPFLRDGHGRDTDESAIYLACNRGKHSVTVDITRPEGAELVRRLAAQCDVLVENYKVGNLARYGLDEPSIRALRPDIVYCSVTGFGVDGPDASRAAYDFVMQGHSGLMSTCGDPAGPPMRTGIPITDLFTGLYATIAILGALMHRQRSGEGQFIDAAMLDASVACNGHMALAWLMGHPAPTRQGNANPVAAPAGVYECADGHCIVTAGNNAQFDTIARTLGHAEWTTDPRFASNPLRVRHRQALDALLAPALRQRRMAPLLAELQAAGVPAGPIHGIEQVFADPQVRHRELQMKLPHARGVEVPSLRSPLRLSATPVVEPAAPPMLGQHTDAVLHDRLGLSSAELRALHDRGVLSPPANR